MQILIDFYIAIKKYYTNLDIYKKKYTTIFFMEISLIGKALDFGSR